MKVWVVTSGSYSEYEYDAIFSTEEKAEEFMKAVPGDWNGVDEVDVDEYKVASKLKEGMNLWRVQMLRDGTVQSAGTYTIGGLTYEERVYVLKPDRFEKRTVPQLNVWCFARNRDHAIKIAGEKRTQSIVEGMWEDGESKPAEPIGKVKEIEILRDKGLEITVDLENKETKS